MLMLGYSTIEYIYLTVLSHFFFLFVFFKSLQHNFQVIVTMYSLLRVLQWRMWWVVDIPAIWKGVSDMMWHGPTGLINVTILSTDSACGFRSVSVGIRLCSVAWFRYACSAVWWEEEEGCQRMQVAAWETGVCWWLALICKLHPSSRKHVLESCGDLKLCEEENEKTSCWLLMK